MATHGSLACRPPVLSYDSFPCPLDQTISIVGVISTVFQEQRWFCGGGRMAAEVPRLGRIVRGEGRHDK